MLAHLLEQLAAFFAPAAPEPHDALVDSSAELVDFERRSRLLDAGGYPFRLHSSVVPRDWSI
jgi:hypothetical protein